jgi:hypothetical protein
VKNYTKKEPKINNPNQSQNTGIKENRTIKENRRMQLKKRTEGTLHQ